MWMKNYVMALNGKYYSENDLNTNAEEFQKDMDDAFIRGNPSKSSSYEPSELYWVFPDCAIQIDISGRNLIFTKTQVDNSIMVMGTVIVTSFIDHYTLEFMESPNSSYRFSSLIDAYYEAMKLLLIN